MGYNAIEKVQAILANRKDIAKMREEGLFSFGEIYDSLRILEDIIIYYRASTIMHRVARFFSEHGFDVVERNRYYVIFVAEDD